MWAKNSSSLSVASGETSVATISASPPYQHHWRDRRHGRPARGQFAGAQPVQDRAGHGRGQLQRCELEAGHVSDNRVQAWQAV